MDPYNYMWDQYMQQRVDDEYMEALAPLLHRSLAPFTAVPQQRTKRQMPGDAPAMASEGKRARVRTSGASIDRAGSMEIG